MSLDPNLLVLTHSLATLIFFPPPLLRMKESPFFPHHSLSTSLILLSSIISNPPLPPTPLFSKHFNQWKGLFLLPSTPISLTGSIPRESLPTRAISMCPPTSPFGKLFLSDVMTTRLLAILAISKSVNWLPPNSGGLASLSLFVNISMVVLFASRTNFWLWSTMGLLKG